MKLWLLDVYLLQITHKELIYQNKQDIITQHTVDKVVENLVWRAVPLLLSRTIIETPLSISLIFFAIKPTNELCLGRY